MQIALIILIVNALLISSFLIIALFVEKKTVIQREVLIHQPVSEVFEYVSDLKNQIHYSKWVMTDPNIQLTYGGTPGQVGHFSSWTSIMKNVGEGKQTFRSIKPNQQIDLLVEFEKPFKSEAIAHFKFHRNTDVETKVEWIFNSESKYPMNLLFKIIGMEKMLGNDIQMGLNNLKSVLEKK